MSSVEESNRPWRRVGDNKEIILFDDGKVIGRKVNLTNSGYQSFSLNGRAAYIHRVVYETFKGEIPKGYQINHINGIKTDNRIENLEVCTRSENRIHAYNTGLQEHI